MNDWVYQSMFLIQDTAAYVKWQIMSRDMLAWLFFFMPFYIFGEFPRYILPAICLSILKILKLPRNDMELKRRFMESHPSVSVLLVGYNEEGCIANAIESLLELPHEELEIIVIDDNSEDRMYEMAKRYADRGQIKLFRNTAATGRSGRPTASNMALHLSSGDFILSVDADTSFDRDILVHMIGPFYNPKTGAIAGNLKPRNMRASLWSKFQAIEYAMSIGIWKRWLNVLGMNMQASGAFGAFRREALAGVGAWDPELAEDADLSLKIKKAGWKIVFAPEAIAMTNVPETRKILTGQRVRWDKGVLRTYFRKHANLFDFRVFDWRNAAEMAMEFLFSIFFTFLYAGYLLIMLIYFPRVLVFVWTAAYIVYALTTVLIFGVSLNFSERQKDEMFLLSTCILFPLYKGYFRWVRLYALVLEIFHINYHETYLPESAWRNTERW